MYNIGIVIAINLLITITSVAYPLLWLVEMEYSSILLKGLPVIMACLWFFKGLIQQTTFQRYLSFGLSFFFIAVSITRSFGTMYWYPVIINILMLILFGSSLFSSQTFVERLARLQIPTLPPQAVLYTRRVTQVWCVVFILNIGITTTLILLEQFYYWALFSGIISYVILASVMAIEWLIRQRMMKKYL